ncbi:hypothetical protein VTN77DRAFT_2386 [Rasamsonia byssochlamydoides]|uniref:uncharacterized protein n=1 Tax=Rasamsonia byssochlamydoides TaxID=89139 RepID=UPI00374263F8
MPPVLPPGYTLHEGYPPVATYLHLRSASGLSPKNTAQAAAALRGSWYGCYISYNHTNANTNSNIDIDTLDSDNTNDDIVGSTAAAADEIVAMGRVIGDGGWYFHIVDMAVLPAHQRRGLGDAILKKLLERIRLEAPAADPETEPAPEVSTEENDEKKNTNASFLPYISLFADEAGRKLYARNGFVESAPRSLGMVLRWNTPEDGNARTSTGESASASS